MTARAILTSDGHFSPRICPAEAECFRRWLIGMSDVFLGRVNVASLSVDMFYESQRQRHTDLVVDEIKKEKRKKPFDFLIDLGDLGSGVGSTAISEKDENETSNTKNGLLKIAGVPEDHAIFVTGNHDTGTTHTWGTDSTPPNEDQFSRVRRVVGPTHGCMQLSDEFHFVWLSTIHAEWLFAQSMQLSLSQLDFVDGKSREELDFLEETLAHIEGKFFLGIHDPSSFLLPRLQRILGHNRQKLAASFTGHIHAEWLMELLKLMRPAIGRATKEFNIQFLPSVWGAILPVPFLIVPTGAGFAELLLEGQTATLIPHIVRRRATHAIYRALDLEPKGRVIYPSKSHFA